MEEKNGTMLDEVIKQRINDLSALPTGSEKETKVIGDLATLYELKLKEESNQREYELEQLKINDEYMHKKMERREQKKDRYFRVGIAAAEIILPLVFYATWMNKGFKFEETGTYTSTTFKGLFNRFRPTKK